MPYLKILRLIFCCAVNHDYANLIRQRDASQSCNKKVVIINFTFFFNFKPTSCFFNSLWLGYAPWSVALCE
jgi:hypothetical protein